MGGLVPAVQPGVDGPADGLGGRCLGQLAGGLVGAHLNAEPDVLDADGGGGDGRDDVGLGGAHDKS